MNISFLNPSFLWALPLALGPLAIHLLYRKDQKRVPFSDLRFIRAALERVEKRLRLKHYLLLLVRTLILALLVMFFARPVWQAGGGAAADGRPSVILLIDVSSSMGYREEGKTRLDRFKAAAHSVVDRLPAAGKAGIIAFSDRVEAATPVLGNDTVYLHRMIDAVTLTARPTDIRPAWDTCRKLFERVPEQGRTVVILSDGASHAFQGALEPSSEKMRVIVFQPAGGENRFITDASAVFDTPGRSWLVRAEGGWTGDGSPAPISFYERDRKTLSDFTRPDKSGFAHEFVWPDAAENLSGRLEIAPDRLMRDNTRYVASSRPASGRVSIIDGDPKFGGAAAESFYLKTALPEARVYTESEQDAMPLSLPGTIVLANVREYSPRLEGFVKAGGGLLVFAGSRTSDETWPGYFPAAIGTVFERTNTVSWSADKHALAGEMPVRDFEWRNLSVERGVVLQCREGAEVLSALSNGWPFIVEGRYGEGRILICASTADREWTNLAGKPVFVPLMQSLTGYLSKTKAGQNDRRLLVGDPFHCPAVPDPAVVAPSGKRVQCTRTGDTIAVNDTEEPGLYRLYSGGKEFLTFAVNVDLRSGEGDLAPASRGALKSYFGDNPVVILPAEGWEKPLAAVMSGKDISSHALGLVFLLLAGEILLVRPVKRAAALLLIAALFAAVPAGLYADQRDSFVFAQMRYDGSWDPYPETWQDILEFVTVTTSIRCESERRPAALSDEALFSSPFLAILGNGRFPALSEHEREILRRYVSNGGLVFVEDSSAGRGSEFDAAFRREMAKAFPETRLKKLPQDHPLYRSYYFLRTVGGRRIVNAYLEGIDVGGRTGIIYSQNDLMGAWAKDRLGNYLWECVPGGQDQRFEAQKLTLNIVMYSVTGTYKSDAIHKPYLEQKRGLQ